MASQGSVQAGAANAAASPASSPSAPTNPRYKRPRTDDDPASEKTGRNGKPRVRVTRACTECRKRKDRCDGRRPVCLSCAQAGRTCNYDSGSSVKKRGLRPGYVRALEVMLGLVFCTIEGSEEWLSSLFGERNIAAPAFSLARETGTWTRAGVDALLDDWRKRKIMSQIDLILAQAEGSENEQGGEPSTSFDQRVVRAIEEASRIVTQQRSATNQDDHHGGLPPGSRMTDPTATALPVLDSRLLEAGNTPLRSDPTVANPSVAFTQPHGNTPDLRVGAIPQSFQPPSHAETDPFLPDNWSSLLDIYFSNCHSWLPISPKHDLLRCAHVLASHTGPPKDLDALSRGDLAFFTGVMAYVGIRTNVAVMHSTRSPPWSSQSSPPALLRKMVALLSEEDDHMDLGSVRTLILLSLIRVQQNKQTAAWAAIGRATYGLTALQAGEGFRTAGQRTILDDDFRRTLLCCISLDSILASWLGVRPYYQASDIAQAGPLSIESMEEWETWQPTNSSGSMCNFPGQAPPSRILSTFNHFLELVGILSELSWAVDPQQGQLRQLEHRLDDLARRMDSRNASTYRTSVVIPPQVLNLLFLAAAVREALRTREIAVTGTYLGRGVADVIKPLQDLGTLVQKQVSQLGSQGMLPIHAICLDIIDVSLERQLHLPCSRPRHTEKIRALRDSFSELDRLWRSECASQNGMGEVTASENSASNASHTQAPRATDGTELSNLMDVSTTPDLDDDALFQSLADLDSADWQVATRRLHERDMLTRNIRSANPPEFMKHLGVMSDLPPDLAVALFDEPRDET